MKCLVCGGDSWSALPVPIETQSMSTSGVVIRQPLEREQCMNCGVLQKSGRRFLGDTRFYEDQYEQYYERPGSSRYDQARYQAMAEWMAAGLKDFRPRKILDIGCGAGWQMAAIAKVYDRAQIEGIEPSVGNAEKARRAGFTVHTTRLQSSETPSDYDLIYANNVLQHVVDPVGFLRDVSLRLSPGGRAAFILPDAAEPCNEMLWSDHNFSFRASDIARMATLTDLKVTAWLPNPPNDALLDKQLVVLQKADAAAPRHELNLDLYSLDELYKRREAYLLKWRAMDDLLRQRTAGSARVFHFGGSMWTWLLAGYCPKYWASVHASLVDNERGKNIGKSVIPTSEADLGKTDCVVLGVNPVTQANFAEKFKNSGARIVMWADWISY